MKKLLLLVVLVKLGGILLQGLTRRSALPTGAVPTPPDLCEVIDLDAQRRSRRAS